MCRNTRVGVLLSAVVLASAAEICTAATAEPGTHPAGGRVGGEPDLRAEFIRLCDAAYPIVEKQARAAERIGRSYYWDSYLVRALAVA